MMVMVMMVLREGRGLQFDGRGKCLKRCGSRIYTTVRALLLRFTSSWRLGSYIVGRTVHLARPHLSSILINS